MKFSDDNAEKRCGDCSFWKTPKCNYANSGTPILKGDSICDEFFQVSKNKDKMTITVNVHDLKNMVNIDVHLLNPSGGFTKNFAYEGLWTINNEGDAIWVLIWDDGAECGMEVIGQGKKWAPKIKIKDEYWKLADPVLIKLKSTWSLGSALNYKETRSAKSPKEIFENVEQIIRYFVDLDYNTPSTDGKYATVAAWAIATYYYELMSMFPILLATGYKGSGKSQLVAAAIYQSYHGSEKIKPSPASTFRMIETCKPTVFLDNAEQLVQSSGMSEESRELSEMLAGGAYAGYKVNRVEGQSGARKIEEYCVYSPKGITTIEGVTGSLESRSILFPMVSTDRDIFSQHSKELKITPFDDYDVMAKQIQQNRDDLYACRMRHWRQIKEKLHILKNSDYGVLDRQWEVWLPIFAVLEVYAPDRIPKVRLFLEESAKLSKESLIDEDKEMAMQALANIWTGKQEYISVKTFANLLAQFKAVTNKNATVTAKQAGNVLRSLGFIERQRKTDGWYFLLNESLLKKHAEQMGIKLNVAEPLPTVPDVSKKNENYLATASQTHLS